MSTPSPAQMIERHRRRRRWFIRLSLLFLVVLVVLGITYAVVFRSPALSLDELRARLKNLPREAGVVELKKLMGEPTEVKPNGMVWMVCYHTWNATDSVIVIADEIPEGGIRFRAMNEMHVEGMDAWSLRWHLILHQLGWK